MAKKELRTKENPKLCQRKLSNGQISLYLEYYLGRSESPRLDKNGNLMYYPEGSKMAGKPMYIVTHNRKKENLQLYLFAKPRTPQERQQNADTLQMAESIRFQKQQEFMQDRIGYSIGKKNENIIAFFDEYTAEYKNKDVRNIRLAVNRFKSFLREYYPHTATRKPHNEIEQIKSDWKQAHEGINGKHDVNENEFYYFRLSPSQFTPDMVQKFIVYLMENSKGSGAATAFERFKKIVKNATAKGIIKTNICEDLVCKRGDNFEKDILSADEMRQLINTHYDKENPTIRRAFIFSLYTGIRFCDVKDLTFENVDYANNCLKFEQAKTKGRSSRSKVTIPLRDDLLALIGTPLKGKKERIFNLPSHTMCLKALRHWTKRAGIDKHITWHCARHSFATNILTNGANVKVVADLLGHSGLSYVERYTRAIDEKKQEAINSLPSLNF